MEKNITDTKENLIPLERITSKIFWMRGKKVMLDHDLANLYGIETKVLNQSFKRNIDRFPEDFMFQLTNEEAIDLRSQFVTLDEKMASERKYDRQFKLIFDVMQRVLDDDKKPKSVIGFK
jgi:hypothetical protein